MTGTNLPLPYQTITDQNGAPISGASIYTYVVGTTTPLATYQDYTLQTANTNPIVTDSAGRYGAYALGNFRAVVYDNNDVLVWDNVSVAALPGSIVSTFMTPVVGAANSTQFLNLSGTQAAINTAIAGVSLLPGPTGPAGPTGPIGPTGPLGGGYAPTVDGNNPGYFLFTNGNGTGLQLYVQGGFAVTNGAGAVISAAGNCYRHFNHRISLNSPRCAAKN